MPATTIDEVLAQLESIIDDSVKNNNRAGYFAALYYKVTNGVKQGIRNNVFEDGPRMETLDVLFANRYLTAYAQWMNKKPTTDAWRVAFETVGKRRPLVLQHLLLGMNAHINLDLGIAVVQAANGQDLQNSSNDFNRINAIISSLTNQVISELNRVSPLLSLMGLHATNYNSILIQFSIDNARDGAWRFAEELAILNGPACDNCITARDKDITQLAESMVHANFLLRLTLWVIHLFEWKKPSRIIKALKEYQKAYLKMSQIAQA
jgi:hypothetical protein